MRSINNFKNSKNYSTTIEKVPVGSYFVELRNGKHYGEYYHKTKKSYDRGTKSYICYKKRMGEKRCFS